MFGLIMCNTMLFVGCLCLCVCVCVRVGGIDRISKNEVIRVAIVEIIFACNPLSYCEKYF